MDESRKSISTTVSETRCEYCRLAFGFQRCPCGALFCDSVCQRKHWRMHKRACAFVCFSDTELGKTLPSDVQRKIFKFLWIPSNRTKWRRRRRAKVIQLEMLGEYNQSQEGFSNRRIASHEQKHMPPLLFLVRKLPKDNQLHSTHLYKDNYFALAW